MSKKTVLRSMRVARPCSENWNDMTGNDQVRFCSHCDKSVNNISALSPKEAVQLVRTSNNNICIRYERDPVTGAPIFAGAVSRLAGRTPKLAAGVMTASLGLSTLTYSQESPEQPAAVPAATAPAKAAPNNAVEQETQKADSPAAGIGNISGTVTDPAGAVIPNAEVKLLDASKNVVRSVTTNDEGRYQIDGVDAGSYRMEISSPGFNSYERDLNLPSSTKRKLDAAMSVGAMGGMMIVVQEYANPLTSAVAADDLDEVRDLLAHGADINEREGDRTTPLFVAIENGNVEIVRTLLEFGAKVNVRNKEGQTPLMQIDSDATPELIDVLIQYRAKLNLVDDDGNTALILAAANSTSEVVKSLVDAGADVNLVNKSGRTALMKAADNDDLESVRALLLGGAKVNLRDEDGESAWDLTSESEIEDLLESYGAETGEPATAATPD